MASIIFQLTCSTHSSLIPVTRKMADLKKKYYMVTCVSNCLLSVLLMMLQIGSLTVLVNGQFSVLHLTGLPFKHLLNPFTWAN